MVSFCLDSVLKTRLFKFYVAYVYLVLSEYISFSISSSTPWECKLYEVPIHDIKFQAMVLSFVNKL
jgi:hypothetical protein